MPELPEVETVRRVLDLPALKALFIRLPFF